MYDNTAMNYEEDFEMEMYGIYSTNDCIEIINDTAKGMLALEIEQESVDDLICESAEKIKKAGLMKEPMIAMLAEEICAKKHTRVREFFDHIAEADGDTSKLTFFETTVYRIACGVLGDAERTIELFGILGPMSDDVLEVCGEYEGGF